METSYTWFAEEHRRWVLRAFGGAAAVSVPSEGTPTPEELAHRLWTWLVIEHGPRLDQRPLDGVPIIERVCIALVDIRQHTMSEAARALQIEPGDLQLRMVNIEDQLRLPPLSRPTCPRWLDLRGVHRLRDDDDHVAAAAQHLDDCLSCARASRDASRRRRWWIARIGHPAAPRRGGVYTVLPAFGDDRGADDPPEDGGLLGTMEAFGQLGEVEHADERISA